MEGDFDSTHTMVEGADRGGRSQSVTQVRKSSQVTPLHVGREVTLITLPTRELR